MALIKGKQAIGARARGEHHERGLRKADPKIPVPPDHLRGLLDIVSSEALQSVRASSDLAEEKKLRGRADPIQQDVVDLGGNERREQERPGVRLEGVLHLFVAVLVRVDQREKPTGIENDHSPKPLRASSTRSARCGSPLRNKPGVGRGLSAAVRCSSASRIKEASDRFRRRASRLRRRFNSGGR